MFVVADPSISQIAFLGKLNVLFSLSFSDATIGNTEHEAVRVFFEISGRIVFGDVNFIRVFEYKC